MSLRGIRRKTLGIIVLIFALSIPAGYLIFDLSRPYLTPLGEKYFQLIGVDVKDEYKYDFRNLWKSSTLPEYEPTYGINMVADKVLRLSKEPGSLLNRTFGNVFPDWSSNTIYFAITEPTPDNINSINRLIGKHENVTVIYVKARATYADLERYLRAADMRYLGA